MPPTRNRIIEFVRWICVLPAAIIGGTLVQFILEAAARLVSYGGRGVLGESNFALQLCCYYVLPKSAFVIAGTYAAPRYQKVTSIVLTIIGVLLSLIKHVVGQHIAGNSVGSINYVHFTAESAGLLIGAACIHFHKRRKPDRFCEAEALPGS